MHHYRRIGRIEAQIRTEIERALAAQAPSGAL
jgi:hypothetical protein